MPVSLATSSPPRRVLLAGATGLVGRALLHQLLADPMVGEVRALTRRALSRSELLGRGGHPPGDERLQVCEIDFERLDRHTELFEVDWVCCAMGTTIRKAGSRAQIITNSNNASGGFVKSLGTHASGTIVTQVFPYERSLSVAMVKEAMDLAKAKGLEGVSPAMLEGFAAAKVLVAGLQRAGANPTRAKLRDALEGLSKLDIGGLEVGFGPNDHTGLEFVDLSIIDSGGKFRR